MNADTPSEEKKETAAFLARMEPFKGATPAEVEFLAVSARLKSFASGAPLFQEGERPAATWVVRGGRVRILTFLAASRTFQLERFGPGQLFGVCCRFGGADRYQCTAVADGPVSALRLPDAAFFSVFQRSPAVARDACRLCSRRLRGMRAAVGDARRGVRPRLAGILLGLRAAEGDEVRATRHALAAWLGAAPETVFRALASLRRRGVISTGRGTVRVLDAAALAAERESGREP